MRDASASKCLRATWFTGTLRGGDKEKISNCRSMLEGERNSRCSDCSAAASSASMRSPFAEREQRGQLRNTLKDGGWIVPSSFSLLYRSSSRVSVEYSVLCAAKERREHVIDDKRWKGTHTRQWRQPGTPPGSTVVGGQGVSSLVPSASMTCLADDAL